MWQNQVTPDHRQKAAGGSRPRTWMASSNAMIFSRCHGLSTDLGLIPVGITSLVGQRYFVILWMTVIRYPRNSCGNLFENIRRMRNTLSEWHGDVGQIGQFVVI